MKKIITNCSALFLLLCVVLGCSRLDLIPGGKSFFDPDEAQKAAKAVREKIGKPFNVAEVFIEDDTFRVQVQNPDKPKNLDEYSYVAGFITGPTPVKLNAMNDNLEKSTFPFDEIDFTAIPEFAREAMEKSGVEGARIYRMTFQRGFAISENDAGSLGSGRWHIEIKGTREDVTATADPKGNLLGVDLSRTSRAADYSVFSKEELKKAQDALTKVPGAKAPISSIVIYEKYLMCNTANAENPNLEETYMFGINGLTRQGLGQIPKVKSSQEEDFSLGDVDLTDAAKYIEKAKQRVDMPDAVVSLVSIKRETKSVMDKTFRTVWSVSLQKGVNNANVYYTNDGKEFRVVKNGEFIFNEK